MNLRGLLILGAMLAAVCLQASPLCGQRRLRFPDPYDDSTVGRGERAIDRGRDAADRAYDGLERGHDNATRTYDNVGSGADRFRNSNSSFDPYSLAPEYGGSSPGGYVDPAFPNQPPAQFPNGMGWNPNWPDGWEFSEPWRFVQGPRVRHTWLAGNDDRELQIHDTDVSMAVMFPNFLTSNQPLYVLPSFSLHMWDGPKGPPLPAAADLPGQAFDAFIDTGWQSDPARIVGVEVGVRVGIFTDFDTLTTDSLRVQGKGLLRYQMTPQLSIRGGVLYVDRAQVKMLPAGGVLWEPNPRTRFDVFFPNPKLSQYLTTFGNHDVWWYLGGEFGGGSWTIERAVDGMSDRVDLNDIRITVGLECGDSALLAEGRRLFFVEAGWVLDREVIYVRRPQDNFTLRDTFMVRGGIAY